MANWLKIDKLENFNEGEPVFHDFDYETAALVRVGDDVYAFEDRCTHDDGPLADGLIDVKNCEVHCPRHGARFNFCTGAALSMPAVTDVPIYPTKIEAGVVYIQPPDEL